jgi:hypothetical protein
MAKILVAVRGRQDIDLIERGADLARAREGSLAICQLLPAGARLMEELSAQQRMTSLLRQRLGPAAEEVAIFVVIDESGDTLRGCAESWGADEVITRDGKTEPRP